VNRQDAKSAEERHGQIGEYIPLYWDWGEPDAEYVRGHVSLEVAREAVGEVCPEYRDAQLSISHCWARWVMPSQDRSYDRAFLLCKRGRGAFPVTAVDYVSAASAGSAVKAPVAP